MNDKFSARKIVSEDWEAYKNIRLEALLNDPQAFGSSFEKESKRTDEEWQEKIKRTEITNPKSFYIGINDKNGKFIGMGGAYEEVPGEWNVIAIYVRKEFRKMGLGKMLMDLLISNMKNVKDIKKLVLKVNVNQTPAINLYKKYGFGIVKTVNDDPMGDGNLYEEYLMTKEI